MKPTSRILVAIAVFLIVDATIYLVTAREFTGGPLIAMTAVSMAFLALVLWVVVHRAASEVQDHPGEVGAVELEHVGPTIWPVGFAVSAAILAVGVAIVAWWLVVVGTIVFLASMVGWTRDIRNQHRHASPAHEMSASD
jgi:hypothetical protein